MQNGGFTGCPDTRGGTCRFYQMKIQMYTLHPERDMWNPEETSPEAHNRDTGGSIKIYPNVQQKLEKVKIIDERSHRNNCV